MSSNTREVDPRRRDSVSHRIAGRLERHSGWFILSVVAGTLLLVMPLLAMAPDERASESPGGRVYDLEELYNTNLPPRFHGSFFIVEARSGDVLTQAPLWELYQNTQELRRADAEGRLNPPGMPEQPYLVNSFDVDRQQPVVGIFTIADAVQVALAGDPLNTTLEQASDEEVKLAVSLVLSDPRTADMKSFLYRETVVDRVVLGREIGYWSAPAMGVFVAADNGKLGGGALRIGATSDPVTETKEHFSRKVQAILRGEERSYGMWGVAIDAGLEIADEVGTAVPFIVATFLTVLVVVGISLRSARVVVLTGLGLAFMIVWLKGLSNLVGLDSSTVLDFIVPIAMISLGADFAIHAVHRYQQERRVALDPRSGFRLGMGGVLGALFLAMLTDAIAFLANATADIETVIGFGIGAGLAIFAAFVIMGLTVPLALMRWDAWRVKPEAGGGDVEEPAAEHGAGPGGWSVAGLLVALARRRFAVLSVTALVTVVAGYFAFQLEATFDVKDFFRSDSDFVVGLDKLDEYVGESGGEPAIIYIQGDLTDPSALVAIQEFVARVAGNPYVAKNDEGEARLQQPRTIFTVLEQVMGRDYARSQVERASGVALPADGALDELRHGGRVYRRPSSREQLEAIYDFVAVNGVPLSPVQDIYDALQVREALFHDATGSHEDATAIVLGIPGSREQTTVVLSRDSLAEDIRLLEEAPSISIAGLTGSSYTRQAALDATTEGLQRALLVAVTACLLVTVVAMRSLRYGLVTILPIGLVVAWLYAFMYVFGFGLNFVTATIAAVSIGVGIDYAIHMTQRFREELARAGDRVVALREAARGTGRALLASAATSTVGFAIMALAPMPMFAAYGFLTAVMIVLAASASLLVLPSLLLLVAPAPQEESWDHARRPATG